MSSRFIALPLLAIPFSPTLVLADITTLSPLVVTSSRLEGINSLAANITVLNSADIAKSPARTLPELLAQQVGITTTSFYGDGSNASVGIRTFGATATQNTLILLDGRRLNDIDLSSVNFSAIPFENIERIEIVRGSGSVLYGDGATSGIINIVTKDPRNSQSHSKLSVTTGSFAHRDVNAFSTYSSDRFGVTANINKTQNNGYREHNRFEQENGQIDIRIPSDSNEVYIKLGGYSQDLDLPGERQVDPLNNINQLQSDRKGSSTLNDWSKEDAVFATLGYSHKINETDSFVIDSSIRQKKQRSQFDYGGGYGDFTESHLDTWSLTPRINFERNIVNLPVSWTLGADLYVYDYQSDRANFEINKNQPIHKIDVDQKSIGIYGQGVVDIDEITSMTLGWRTQRVTQNANDTFDATAPGGSYGSEATSFKAEDQENSYEIGIKRLLAENWQVFGKIGRSIRFGNVDELFETNNAYQQVFSALTPQTSRDIELGLNFQNHWLYSSMTYFHQDINNEIGFNPVTFQNVNLDDTQHKGLELSLETQAIPRIDLSAHYTYLNAKFVDGENAGKTLPLIPKHSYTVIAQTVLPAKIQAAISWNYVGDSFFSNDASNNFGQTIPSYQTVDLKLTKKIEQLELAIMVNNLFSENYYNYGINSTSAAGKYNAYPLAELNAYIMLSYEFD